MFMCSHSLKMVIPDALECEHPHSWLIPEDKAADGIFAILDKGAGRL